MYVLGRILTVIIALVITIVAICGGYIIYLNVNSARIEDGQSDILNIRHAEEGAAADTSVQSVMTPPAMTAGKTYKALTYNIGYGANGHDFSFFMSEGKTVEGNKTKGRMSRAKDERTVKENINAVTSLMQKQSPDIALFQEVDKEAGRSYHYDEYKAIAKAFAEKSGKGNHGVSDVYATNFHTGWLLYPPVHPIGQIKDSGIVTLSRYNIDSAERRSLPVAASFPEKYFELDRCVTVVRLPVEEAKSSSADADSDDADADIDSDSAGAGEDSDDVDVDADEDSADADVDVGADEDEDSDSASSAGGESVRELVLINVHLSAFDAGLDSRDSQLKEINNMMQEELNKGNWVIAGGDWNQCFPGSFDTFKSRMETPEWAQAFDEDMTPLEGFSYVTADNADITATCRDTSIPWSPGINYETIIDGWIVSDNISASAENIDTEYAFSDHNPVSLTFSLNP